MKNFTVIFFKKIFCALFPSLKLTCSGLEKAIDLVVDSRKLGRTLF